MTDGIDIAIDGIKEEVIALKQRLSQYRKKGVDTKIVEFRIASIPSKLMMIKVTRDQKDVQKATQMLYLAKSDAEDLEKEYKEALAYTKPQEPDPAIIEINYDIDLALIERQKNNIPLAKSYYLKAYKSYNSLDVEKKKKVFTALNNLRIALS